MISWWVVKRRSYPNGLVDLECYRVRCFSPSPFLTSIGSHLEWLLIGLDVVSQYSDDIQIYITIAGIQANHL